MRLNCQLARLDLEDAAGGDASSMCGKVSSELWHSPCAVCYKKQGWMQG